MNRPVPPGSMIGLVVFLLFCSTLLYALAPLAGAMGQPRETAQVTDYLRQDSLELQGIVVREETPLPAPDPRWVPLRTDGQAVAAGAEVASWGDVTIAAPAAGIYLRETDGWEALSPSHLTQLSPSVLDQYLDTPDRSGQWAGKIVTSFAWYFAAAAPEALCAQLEVGQRYRLSLRLPDSSPMDCTLQFLSPPENGRCVAAFRCTTHLQAVLQFRRLTAAIEETKLEGLQVPAPAVREDETGTFVYALSAGRPEQRYVTVLWKNNEYAVLEKDKHTNALQSGDTVLLGPPTD